MALDRREFLTLAATAAAAFSSGALALPTSAGAQPIAARIKWIVFDAFPIFDTRSIKALAENMFPGSGSGLSDAWRVRQFEYTWLRVTSQHYADFWQVTRDALMYSLELLKLKASAKQIDTLMNAYLSLKPWPDLVPALSALKGQGFRFAILSNFTTHMLEANIRSASLDGWFDRVLSSDEAKTFKPDPRAYQLGLDELGVSRDEILFVAFGGWDAVGAKLFGYSTFWFNPLQLPPERFGPLADGEGLNAMDLVRFVSQTKAAS